MSELSPTDPTPDDPDTLDPRVVEYLKTHCGPNCYGEQDENGVDLSIIRENLRRTPAERLLRGDRFTRDLQWLDKNVRRPVHL